MCPFVVIRVKNDFGSFAWDRFYAKNLEGEGIICNFAVK